MTDSTDLSYPLSDRQQSTPIKGLKYDADKPRMDLLDPSFTEGVARVLTFGARKYAADNWRGGIEFTRTISAIHRHLAAIQKGEDIDTESGEPHIYHIGCNVQFLGWMMQNMPEMDDRYKHSPRIATQTPSENWVMEGFLDEGK